MSIYRCYDCQEFVDDDYFTSEPHPYFPFEVLCPACWLALEMEDAQDEEV